MASRRTRIKGIANIPQRRKAIAGASTEGENKAAIISENETKTEQLNLDNVELKTADVAEKPAVSNSMSEENETIKITDELLINNNGMKESEQENSVKKEIIVPQEKQESLVTETEVKNVLETKSESLPKNDKPPLIRRKFIKPTVAVGAINRNRPSKVVENSNSSTIETEAQKQSEKIKILSNDVVKSTTVENTLNTPPVPIEVTLNETIITSDQPEKSDLITGITKLTPSQPAPLAPISQSSVIEKIESYPPPPTSPNKINRSRFKAVPRLNSQRKTSFSASESEDESKRTFYHPSNNYRHRNDSVCSTTSTAEQVPPPECLSPQRPMKDSYLQHSLLTIPTSSTQKKPRRSEQSRKLANARMDFYVKFGHNKPDRQKLTMMDLIFYNPATNPMSEGKKGAKSSESVEEIVENVEEDEEEEKEAESDEENAMPVPQIKIGPQGEIIIDEKSLVIENKETKRTRRQMERSKVIDGDFETKYGVYKRAKRSKFWSQNETLRFYKALNTIGTDFSLMCELFPKRSRRELKLKFKKEERVNRTLIDKAIMQPRKFEFAELKSEVDVEEREIEELERISQIEEEEKKAREEQRKRKANKSAEKSTAVTENTNKKERKRQPKRRKLDIRSVVENESDNEADVDSPDEDVQINALPKPTRSGRIPKMVNKFSENADLNEVDNFIEQSQLIDKSVECNNKNLSKNNSKRNEERCEGGSNKKTEPSIEPGSIMFVPSEGDNGQVIKILMVTSDKKNGNKTGTGIENILTISATASGAEDNDELVENNITIPAEPENNITIPADEINIIIPNGENNIIIPASENNITIPADETEN